MKARDFTWAYNDALTVHAWDERSTAYQEQGKALCGRETYPGRPDSSFELHNVASAHKVCCMKADFHPATYRDLWRACQRLAYVQNVTGIDPKTIFVPSDGGLPYRTGT